MILTGRNPTEANVDAQLVEQFRKGITMPGIRLYTRDLANVCTTIITLKNPRVIAKNDGTLAYLSFIENELNININCAPRHVAVRQFGTLNFQAGDHAGSWIAQVDFLFPH